MDWLKNTVISVSCKETKLTQPKFSKPEGKKKKKKGDVTKKVIYAFTSNINSILSREYHCTDSE